MERPIALTGTVNCNTPRGTAIEGDNHPSALWNAGFLQSPTKRINPVLAEKWLILEDHGWHAPVSGRVEGCLIALYFRLMITILDRLVQLGKVQSCLRNRIAKLRALVPVLAATEDERRYVPGHFEPLATPVRLDSQFRVIVVKSCTIGSGRSG